MGEISRPTSQNPRSQEVVRELATFTSGEKLKTADGDIRLEVLHADRGEQIIKAKVTLLTSAWARETYSVGQELIFSPASEHGKWIEQDPGYCRDKPFASVLIVQDRKKN